MKAFNGNDFLLYNDCGKRLFHQVAATLPVIDPHNHIDPSALATNKQYENIYQLWVQNDPYKLRAMRIFGIAEDLITGNKSDYEKFEAWANCFPATVGNPLFHWCCMELKEIFGITEMLNASTAKQIWEKANSKLTQGNLGALDILKKLGVQMLCTSDDLVDSLEHHIALAKQQNEITCLPSLRCDSMVAFNQPAFINWLQKLQTVTGIVIINLKTYKDAIINRLIFFDEAGCLLSDHSFDSGFIYITANEAEAENIFDIVLKKESLNEKQFIILQSHLLYFLGKQYTQRNWKMQLHIGAHRNTSTVLRNKVGPAGGYACIGNTANISSLTLFLDQLDIANALPKTILYTLNPADNAVFASITGSYAQDGVQGKIQYGPAWWYNDHYEGITQQLIALSSYGLLATSIGMTTDSRSIVSFIRHNYYRRILCNLIGSWVEEGKLPNDWEMLSTLIKNISYYNIKNWIAK
jgi:glucuronate isomerase